MTPERHPLALLADWLEAERDEPAATRLLGRPMTARLEDARAAVFNLDPIALRAQAEAEAGLREALVTVLSACKLQQTSWPEYHPYMTLSMTDFETARAALAQAGGES